MKRQSGRLGFGALVVGAALAASAARADVKIGVIYDYTGPFAAGGSKAAAIGNKIAIDMINEKGGVEGHKIVADLRRRAVEDRRRDQRGRAAAQRGRRSTCSWASISSAHCVPMAAKVDAAKKFMWANVCVASAVFKDKNLQYVFRPQVHSDQFGEASCKFLAENAKAKLGKEVKDLKVAIIHEDGPYGVGVAAGNEATCKELGMQIVHKEGYAATSTDLSALVTKLRRAQPDVILHTGYNPDITLFLRQAKEAGLKFAALIGHGAGYGQIDKLIETFKDDVNYVYNVDPVAAQLLDPKTLKPGPRRPHRRDGQALQGRDRRAARCRRTSRWASTRPGSSSPTCCRARSRSTAASIPRRCARRRSRPTSRRAARSRATA